MKHIKSFHLFEDHMQGELIFGKKNGDPINDKPDHVHFVDAIQALSRKTNFKGPFKNEGSYEDYYKDEEMREKALTTLRNIEQFGDDFYLEFFNDYPLEDNPELYDKEWFESNDMEFTNDGLSSVQYGDIDDDLLSKEGKERFEAFTSGQADVFSNEYGLEDALSNADEDGLDIYRAMSIKGSSGQTVYKEMVEQFSGVGYYWSFDEDGAVPHSGGAGTTYIIHGKVRFQDINWGNTFYKSIYNLREEKEIEVSPSAIIKIEDVKVSTGNGEVSLDLGESPLYVEP